MTCMSCIGQWYGAYISMLISGTTLNRTYLLCADQFANDIETNIDVSKTAATESIFDKSLLEHLEEREDLREACENLLF